MICRKMLTLSSVVYTVEAVINEQKQEMKEMPQMVALLATETALEATIYALGREG